MNRYGLTDQERFALVTAQCVAGQAYFSCYGAKRLSWGYRPCSVFSVPNSERFANVDALKAQGYRVFDQDNGREL